jgi:type VI secretion system secreted protein VgrG
MPSFDFSATTSTAAHAAAALLTGEQSTFLTFSMGVFPADLFVVAGFTGREGISELYSFEIDLLTDLNEEAILAMSAGVLRQPACLRIAIPGMSPRSVHGVVARFTVVGVAPAQDQVRLRVTVVPSLWLAGHRVQSRIFQEHRVDEIVEMVLAEWKITASWRLKEKLSYRTYCTQYRETDLAFIQRLLAEEGVFFFFEQPAFGLEEMLGAAGGVVHGAVALAGSAAQAIGGAAGAAVGDVVDMSTRMSAECVVFTDHVEAYPGVLDGSIEQGAAAGVMAVVGTSSLGGQIVEALQPSPSLTFDPRTDEPREDCVYVFSPADQALMESTLLGDYDFRRPMYNIRAGASTAANAGETLQATAEASAKATIHASLDPTKGLSVGGALNQLTATAAANVPSLQRAQRFRFYNHDDLPEDESHWENVEADKSRARRVLEQLRREAHAGQGRSWCHRLEAGRRFRLEGHPVGWFNAEHVITRIIHHFDRDLDPATGQKRGDGSARAVYFNEFSTVPASVRFRPEVPVRPARQVMETAVTVGPPGEEIHVDRYGRIKVQFHWDLNGTYSDRSSCWIRVMQGWAGAGFGTQFIPRVGMEVLVTFLNGNPDRPLVVGCVPNEIHPLPFDLPEDKTRSGVRTRSSPGGGGGQNELSFEDRTGQEQIYIHAERDLDSDIKRNQTHRVHVDEFRSVGHDQNIEVAHDQIVRVGNDRYDTVVGEAIRRVEKNDTSTVVGNAVEGFMSDRNTFVQGRDRREVHDRVDEVMKDDLTFRVEGCFTTIVGKHDAKRSATLHVEGTSMLSSLDATEIVSEKRIVLRCGDSQVLIGPKSIEIQSPTIVLKATDTTVRASEGKFRLEAKKAAVVKSPKTRLQGEGARMLLTKEALLDGQKVKLYCGSDQDDETVKEETKPPTIVKLNDPESGKPLPNQRFLISQADGTEISGVGDSEGKAVLDLEQDGKLTFLDVTEVT